MTVPANLMAGFFGNNAAFPVTLSITAPANGSTIVSNSIPEAITGTAASTAGNIVTLQYEIDGGAWTNFSFAPAASVNYSGGNAGQIGEGSHNVSVKAIDAVGNSLIVGSNYSISSASPPSYTWTPSDTYTNQYTYLTITGASPSATVAYVQTIYNSSGAVIASNPLTPLGSTDGSGNFSYRSTTNWPAGGWSDTVNLYVAGVNVAAFNFYNFGIGPTYSYGPSIAPPGQTVTLNIANSWGSATVTQQTTFYPSGTVGPVTTLGSTSATGNFSYSATASWGTDTSCTTVVYLNGVSVGSFGFAS